MKRMKGMTDEEKSIFWCVVHNLAQEVAYRVDRYNDAYDEDLKPSIRKRREREMFKAVERLAERYNEGISDAALRYFGGETAVRQRDQRLTRQMGNVVPFKRRGVLVKPPVREE